MDNIRLCSTSSRMDAPQNWNHILPLCGVWVNKSLSECQRLKARIILKIGWCCCKYKKEKSWNHKFQHQQRVPNYLLLKRLWKVLYGLEIFIKSTRNNATKYHLWFYKTLTMISGVAGIKSLSYSPLWDLYMLLNGISKSAAV